MYVDHDGISRWSSIDRWAMSNLGGLVDFMTKTTHHSRIRRALPYIRGPRVLEVSFGGGYLMTKYAKQFEVTGIDYNPACVARAKRRLQKRGMSANLLQGDVHDLPFSDATFNTVLIADAFNLYKDPERAMQEIVRVLAPGGRFILHDYDDPSDNNLLGRLWAAQARVLWRLPHFDSRGVLGSRGLPYEDRAVGGFGAFHMFIMERIG